MCDTLVALPIVTAPGTTLFAKNSDRERNEAQGVELHPARRHDEGSAIALTYISIAQAPRTRACLIARPFSMWGAEMGANDAGVAIGNEAVHSVIAAQETGALTGMDLVRLGLERAGTAAEAVEIMTALLERHGQGGDCGHLEPFYYHNSFIVADPREAYVLETIGRWWAVQRVERSRAISNVLSINANDRTVSDALADHARAEDWCEADGRFDVAARLWDPERDVATRGVERCRRASTLLEQCGDRIAISDLMRIVRDHGPDAAADPGWSPAKIVGRSICMHAGGGDRRSQSVGSMVSDLREARAVHWATASSAPCLSVFKPVVLEADLPDQGAPPRDRVDLGSRWWRHERLHRSALGDYANTVAAIAPARDALEASFRDRVEEALRADAGPDRLREVCAACWREADEAEAAWVSIASAASANSDDAYTESWARLNRLAGLDALGA